MSAAPEELNPSIQKRIDTWLTGPYDEKTKEEIRHLYLTDKTLLQDAFYTDLSFGTAGLRELMGVGPNRINEYTIKMATQGLANYILKQPKSPSGHKVFIGFDSRHHSLEFAQDAAEVFAANGIEVLLLKEMRPVPFVSFGTRYEKCIAGVMITASHNPKEYNGYKVYWSDGAQIVPPHDLGIIAEVHKITTIQQVKQTAHNNPLIHIVNAQGEIDKAYLQAIRSLQHYPEDNKTLGSKLKITYTSLHGTGIKTAPQALKDWGFSNLVYVDEQIIPDGDFPTVKFPNPEYKETLTLGIKRLKETDSDLLIATDPDADRLGIVVKDRENFVTLTGNEMAAICAHFICDTLSKQKKLPSNGALVTTIVSTELLKEIAKAYHVHCVEVLTGFKYIGEQIHLWETSNKGYTFIFGAEESYGCLLGTASRDKDATVAACLIAEIALHEKKEQRTLVDALNFIYKTYGVYREKQFSLNFPASKEGMDKMSSLMTNLRNAPLKQIAGSPVVSIEDYQTSQVTYVKEKREEALTLPKSNVLIYRTAEGSKLIVRPSGTEPKIKLYASSHLKTFSSIPDAIRTCDAKIEDILNAVRNGS